MMEVSIRVVFLAPAAPVAPSSCSGCCTSFPPFTAPSSTHPPDTPPLWTSLGQKRRLKQTGL